MQPGKQNGPEYTYDLVQGSSSRDCTKGFVVSMKGFQTHTEEVKITTILWIYLLPTLLTHIHLNDLM